MGFEMPETTLTRSELLTERGYDTNGMTNGSSPAPAQRECSNCHGPIPADRPRTFTTCSTECSEQRRITQQRQRDAKRRQRQRATKPKPTPTSPAPSPTTRETPTVTILDVIAELDIVAVEVQVAGGRWLLTRQD
jgi:hypothetical protein